MNLRDIEQATSVIEQKTDELKEKLIERIMLLPDNPRITRLAPNCFTMKMSDLGTTNWTPFYNDFKLQYETLVMVIRATPLASLTKKLKGIIETGVYRKERFSTYHFHPDVINELKDLLEV